MPIDSAGFYGTKNLGNRIAGDAMVKYVIGTRDPDALEQLVADGYSLAYGARFLKRIIEAKIKLPISQRWAEGEEFVATVEPTYDSWFVQGDYVFYPWLHGAARYETVTPGDRNVPSLRTGVFNVSGLVRANIKAIVEYQRDLREAKNHSLDVVLRFAF